MATAPLPLIAAAALPSTIIAEGVERAVFVLLSPFKDTVDGEERDICNVEMREIGTADLPLLDRYRGQPIALAQNLIAALCDLTVEQVQQFDLDDFTMLSSDALFQVEQIADDMGLPPTFFLDPPALSAPDAPPRPADAAQDD